MADLAVVWVLSEGKLELLFGGGEIPVVVLEDGPEGCVGRCHRGVQLESLLREYLRLGETFVGWKKAVFRQLCVAVGHSLVGESEP